MRQIGEDFPPDGGGQGFEDSLHANQFKELPNRLQAGENGIKELVK